MKAPPDPSGAGASLVRASGLATAPGAATGCHPEKTCVKLLSRKEESSLLVKTNGHIKKKTGSLVTAASFSVNCGGGGSASNSVKSRLNQPPIECTL